MCSRLSFSSTVMAYRYSTDCAVLSIVATVSGIYLHTEFDETDIRPGALVGGLSVELHLGSMAANYEPSDYD